VQIDRLGTTLERVARSAHADRPFRSPAGSVSSAIHAR
jgi:hypothetical protein